MSRFSRSAVTAGLLMIIGVIFALEFLSGAIWDDTILRQFGAIEHGLLQSGEYWRLLAAMFLHANVLHWVVNSWALYQLGTLFEAMFGSSRFAAVYFVSGLVASIASSLRIPEGGLSVGASGAIFGILGAFIVALRRSPQWRDVPWARGLRAQLIFWAIVNIVFGLNVRFIDNTAHIAGLVTGLIFGFLPHRVPPPPPGNAILDVEPVRTSAESAADPGERTTGR
jgi:rhomboid protease GluP